MTDTPTLVQMPTLSERLSPLQRTIAESYQRVFMRGNRTDDLLIFSSLINEIADNSDARRPALGYVEATKLTEQVEALQSSEDDLSDKLKAASAELREIYEALKEFNNPDANELDTAAGLIGFIIFWHNAYKDQSRSLSHQVQSLLSGEAETELNELKNAINEFKTWDPDVPVDYPARVRFLIHSEQAHSDKVDELSLKLKDANELIEGFQDCQEKSRAILKEALGEDANVDFRAVHESIVYLVRQWLLESNKETKSLQDEIALLKDQLKDAKEIIDRHENDIAKSREHLISVLGEAQVDGVPLSGAVLVLKGRYSGACARIAQQEAALAQKATVVVEASKEPASPVATTHAVVHIEDSPRQAQDKRNPFLRVDGIFQFQSANPNVPWVALSNFDIPRPLLKSMLQMAIGEANTWHDICKTLSVNSDVARDIQRGFAHLINKLRTKAAGAPEIDEAIDKKPEAKMLEVAI